MNSGNPRTSMPIDGVTELVDQLGSAIFSNVFFNGLPYCVTYPRLSPSCHFSNYMAKNNLR